MSKSFRVTVPFVVFVETEIEAESKEEAIEIGEREADICVFCGNGGNDKLVGVVDSDWSIDAGDIICFPPFGSDAEEI